MGTNTNPNGTTERSAHSRPSLRRALIRFLGGQGGPGAPEPGQAAEVTAASTSPTPGFAAPTWQPPHVASPAIPPPAPPQPVDPAQVFHQAERYFAYAELLAQQGSGDLAGAVYRQAYVGLRALFATAGSPPLGQQPALPPARPVQVTARSTPPGAASVAPAQAGLASQLEALKDRLSSATAQQVEQQLLQLVGQGHRHADLTNLLGLATLLQERRDEAERWFRETLRLDPRHYRALVNLGGLLLSTNRPEEAIQQLSTAIGLINPQSEEALAALTNLSLAHQQLGRPMDAAQLALRIFRIKPNHLRPQSLAAAAQTLEEMGEEQAAIDLLQHLRGRGAGPELIRRLAQLLERQGDFQQAATVYRDLLANPGATAPSP